MALKLSKICGARSVCPSMYGTSERKPFLTMRAQTRPTRSYLDFENVTYALGGRDYAGRNVPNIICSCSFSMFTKLLHSLAFKMSSSLCIWIFMCNSSAISRWYVRGDKSYENMLPFFNFFPTYKMQQNVLVRFVSTTTYV